MYFFLVFREKWLFFSLYYREERFVLVTSHTVFGEELTYIQKKSSMQ